MGQVKNSGTDSVLPDTEGVINEYTNINGETKKRYKCTFPECSLAFLRPSRLERHVRVHTGERHFKCSYPECNKAYTNNCHLQRHMKSHKIDRDIFKCPECTLYLRSKHNLKHHFNRMHKNLDKLTCKKCKKVFSKKYQLQKHIIEHSTSYICDICDKPFKDTGKLNRHKKIHEPGNERYPCPVWGCTEVLSKWLFLQAHIKTQHVNDHRCKDCNKVFLSRLHLKRHSVIHLEDRPRLSCPYEKCPRVYKAQSNLTTHIRVNHLGKKFECDICKVKIVSKTKLREHIEKLHMSERKIKEMKRPRKKRKDIGIPTRSAVSKLVGVNLPPKVEKLVLERKEAIEYLDQFETVTVTEDPKVDS